MQVIHGASPRSESMPGGADTRRQPSIRPVPAHLLELSVDSIREVARDIREFTLSDTGGLELPVFDPGAHIDLHLPNGLVRSYSLVGDPDERRAYSVAVARDRASRGGSSYMFESLREGDRIAVSPPRNHFPLEEAATHSVLIAGGIGITPIWAMVRRLVLLGAPWTLHYATRARASAAYIDEIQAVAEAGNGHVEFWFDDERGSWLDVAAIARTAPANSHLYCCGPTPMLLAFQEATAVRDPAFVHTEFFRAPDIEPGEEQTRPLGGFIVELAGSGRSVEVPEGSTILDALIMNGIDVPYSCYEGLCGTCETRVLAGIPDHRDALLTEKAKASNESIIICCSGSHSERLVLDI